MKTLTRNLIVLILCLLSFCQYIHAQDIEPPKRNLEFVNSDEYEVLDPSMKGYLGDSLPTHVAILKIAANSPGGFRMPINKAIIVSQINIFSSVRGGISLFQCIIKGDDSSKTLKFMYFIPNRLNSNNSQIYYILANSEQQARQFTEALINSYDIPISVNLKELKSELETYQDIVREGETVIAKMEAEYRELETQKNSLYKEYAKVNYLSEANLPDIRDMVKDELRRSPSIEDKNIPGIDNIIKVKDELARSLREVDFELVGLNAKIESVNKYKLSGTIIDDETLIKLNQILMATDIERAGVLARKQAFETSFKQITQLYNLMLSSKKVLVDLEKYKNRFNTAPQVVSLREAELKNPSEMYRYVQVEDNKVTIKPVKQD